MIRGKNTQLLIGVDVVSSKLLTANKRHEVVKRGFVDFSGSTKKTRFTVHSTHERFYAREYPRQFFVSRWLRWDLPSFRLRRVS
jgi:hypothetical protein